MIGEIIAIACIALIICGVVVYIVKAQKSGRKCIGCPDGASCASKNGDKKCGGCNGNCSCCSKIETADEEEENE